MEREQGCDEETHCERGGVHERDEGDRQERSHCEPRDPRECGTRRGSALVSVVSAVSRIQRHETLRAWR